MPSRLLTRQSRGGVGGGDEEEEEEEEEEDVPAPDQRGWSAGQPGERLRGCSGCFPPVLLVDAAAAAAAAAAGTDRDLRLLNYYCCSSLHTHTRPRAHTPTDWLAWLGDWLSGPWLQQPSPAKHVTVQARGSSDGAAARSCCWRRRWRRWCCWSLLSSRARDGSGRDSSGGQCV